MDAVTPEQLHGLLAQFVAGRADLDHVIRGLDTKPGFATSLCALVATPAVDGYVRYLSAITLKRTVEKYWHPGPSTIAETEKAQIRGGIIALLVQEHDKISVEIASVVAQIARHDFPDRWRDLFQQLQGMIAQGGHVRKVAFLALYRVILALCSRRIRNALVLVRQYAPALFDTAYLLWKQESAVAAADPMRGQEFMIASKVLRVLVQYALNSATPAVIEFLTNLPTVLAALLPQRRGSVYLHRAARALLKAMVAAADQQIDSAALFLPQHLAFAAAAVSQMPPDDEACSLLFSVLQTAISIAHNATPGPGQAAAAAFFDADRVRQLCQTAVTRFLVLSREELSAWAADAEGFSDESTDMPRAQAERLLAVCIEHYRYPTTELLTGMLDSLWRGPRSEEAAMAEDALLRAAGICVFELSQAPGVPGPLVQRALALIREPSLADGSAPMGLSMPAQTWAGRVLLRRALWLLACYRAHLPREVRVSAVEMIGSRLAVRAPVDVPVALTAAATLQCCTLAALHEDYSPLLPLLLLLLLCSSSREASNSSAGAVVVEDVDFHAEDIVGFLRALVHALLTLLSSVRELESKQLVLGVLVALLHGTHEVLRPLISELVPALQALWRGRAVGEPIFRGQIVQAMTELVEAVDVGAADALSAVTVPMVRECFLGPGSDILMDEAMVLLRSTLDSVRVMNADLAALFEQLVAVFMGEQFTRDNVMLRASLHALQSYLLLGGRSFLMTHAGAVVACLDKCVGNVNDVASFTAMDILDTTLKLAPELAPMLNAPLARVAADATAPERPEQVVGGRQRVVRTADSPSSVPDVLRAQAQAIMARVMLVAPDFFFQFVQWPAQPGNLLRLMQCWVENINSINGNERRRLVAFALLALISRPDLAPHVAPHMAAIIDAFVSVLHDPVDASYDLTSDADLAAMSGVVAARVRLFRTDPAHTRPLHEPIMQTLSSVAASSPLMADALRAVDPVLLQQLQHPRPPAEPLRQA